MKIALVACVLLLARGVGAQTDGKPHGFCQLSGSDDATQAFTVDDDLAAELDAITAGFPTTVDETYVLMALDQAVHTWARESRAKLRWKISSVTAECSMTQTTTNCIAPVFNSDTFVGNSCATGAAGFVLGGASEAWRIGICINQFDDPIGNLFWVREFNQVGQGIIPAYVFTHEFGHTHVLTHSDLTALCPTTTDGCDGENMCATTTGMRSHHLTAGDTKGVRAEFMGGVAEMGHRFVDTGSRALGGTSVALDVGIGGETKMATFQPRIDCATFTNSVADCVAILGQETGGTSQAEIVALLDWNSGGWLDAATVLTQTAGLQMAPDIALSPDGEEAFVVSVSANNNNTWLWRIDMITGSVTSQPVIFDDPDGDPDRQYQSVLPPRVDYNTDLSPDGVIVVGVHVANAGDTPRWIAHRAHWNGTSITITAPFTTLDRPPCARDQRVI